MRGGGGLVGEEGRGRGRDGAVGESTRLPPVWPGSIPALGAICGLRFMLVLVFVPRGFSTGTPVFLSPHKPTFVNFQFDLESVPN